MVPEKTYSGAWYCDRQTAARNCACCKPVTITIYPAQSRPSPTPPPLPRNRHERRRAAKLKDRPHD